MRLQVENVSSKTTGSVNKSLNNFEANRLYSSFLSSNFKSIEGIMNKNIPTALNIPTSIM